MSLPSARQLLLEALNQRQQAFMDELKTCRKHFSEEAVHDMRVATRRLLAVVDALRATMPHPRQNKIRRALKDWLDRFDDLRDTQVMLVEIGKTVADVPALAPFQVALEKREKRLLRVAARDVQTQSNRDLKRRLQAVQKSLNLTQQDEILDIMLIAAADQAYATVCQRAALARADTPTSIHAVRIAFKKFRYLVEILAPTLPAFPPAQFSAMQTFQSTLGELQDAEVFLKNLEQFRHKQAEFDLTSAWGYSTSRHERALAACMEQMGTHSSFWRSTPMEAFPWESSNLSTNQ